jgi:hypothetical protein
MIKIEPTQLRTRIMAAANSTYPTGGVSCSKDRFVVNGTFVLLINICGELPALRVAANRSKYGVSMQRKNNNCFSLNELLSNFCLL